MAKYSIYSNGTHLGQISAGSNDEALRLARDLYQNVPNLRVENTEPEDSHKNAADYTMSKTEMQKMIKLMAGR